MSSDSDPSDLDFPLPSPPLESAAAPEDLPRITEVKRKLLGGEKRFNCRVLERDGAHLVVLFVASVPMQVQGVSLPAGTVTFGHFWTDRPYNVYHWLDQRDGATIGYYLNLADETRIKEGLLEWLDLVVDILVLPNDAPLILDEDEIPAAADATLRERIDRARVTALNDLPATIILLERFREKRWPLREAPLRGADRDP